MEKLQFRYRTHTDFHTILFTAITVSLMTNLVLFNAAITFSRFVAVETTKNHWIGL